MVHSAVTTSETIASTGGYDRPLACRAYGLSSICAFNDRKRLQRALVARGAEAGASWAIQGRRHQYDRYRRDLHSQRLITMGSLNVTMTSSGAITSRTTPNGRALVAS